MHFYYSPRHRLVINEPLIIYRPEMAYHESQRAFGHRLICSYLDAPRQCLFQSYSATSLADGASAGHLMLCLFSGFRMPAFTLFIADVDLFKMTRGFSSL